MSSSRTGKLNRLLWLWLQTLLCVPVFVNARPGDWGQGIVVDGYPFLHAGSTASRSTSRINRYSCAPNLPEEGPETVYIVQVEQAGVLSANVTGDSAQVDIDLHLLSGEGSDGSLALDCIERDNRSLSTELRAGTYYLVVDTYQDASLAGPYLLHIDFHAYGQWNRREIAQGVTLETKFYESLFGGVQTGSVLRANLNDPDVEIRPVEANGCQKTSELAAQVGAVAAINGGYFDSTCNSVSLLKIHGQTLSRNARNRSSIGFDENGQAMIEWVNAQSNWPSAYHAMGGLARLITDGQLNVEWERDGADYGFTYGRHPRTAVGFDDRNQLILATLDGRTSAGAGVSLFDLAQWMVWLGADQALNLDGGGSTTLWTRTHGVVNFPSDNGVADHYGERGVSSILAIFAPPLNRPIRWVSNTSNPTVLAGDTVDLDILAIDPDGQRLELTVQTSGIGNIEYEDRGDGSIWISYQTSPNDAEAIDIYVDADAEAGMVERYTINVNVLNSTVTEDDNGDSPNHTDSEPRDGDTNTVEDHDQEPNDNLDAGTEELPDPSSTNPASDIGSRQETTQEQDAFGSSPPDGFQDSMMAKDDGYYGSKAFDESQLDSSSTGCRQTSNSLDFIFCLSILTLLLNRRDKRSLSSERSAGHG